MTAKPHEGSPHGVSVVRDLSGQPYRASGDPTSSMSEHALLRGYRCSWDGDRRVERCVCGGDIEAPDDWRAIAQAVDIHNDSTLHQQWRAWRDLMP